MRWICSFLLSIAASIPAVASAGRSFVPFEVRCSLRAQNVPGTSLPVNETRIVRLEAEGHLPGGKANIAVIGDYELSVGTSSTLARPGRIELSDYTLRLRHRSAGWTVEALSDDDPAPHPSTSKAVIKVADLTLRLPGKGWLRAMCSHRPIPAGPDALELRH
jgi:hypothetical protein